MIFFGWPDYCYWWTFRCEACSEMTHSTRTLAKHRRIPLSEKPKEKPKCPYHTSHVMEFTCLEIECQAAPLMCYICKDYGRHKVKKPKATKINWFLWKGFYYLFPGSSAQFAWNRGGKNEKKYGQVHWKVEKVDGGHYRDFEKVRRNTTGVPRFFLRKRGKESTFSLTAFLDHGVSSGWKHRDSRQSQNEGQSLLSIPSRSGLLRAAALMPQTS